MTLHDTSVFDLEKHLYPKVSRNPDQQITSCLEKRKFLCFLGKMMLLHMARGVGGGDSGQSLGPLQAPCPGQLPLSLSKICAPKMASRPGYVTSDASKPTSEHMGGPDRDDL